MIEQVDQAPQTVVAVLEGAVLGGGFGLACVPDIAMSRDTAQFSLPETFRCFASANRTVCGETIGRLKHVVWHC